MGDLQKVLEVLPTGYLGLARLFAPQFPGDRVSIIVAQGILESGWFRESDAWLKAGNPWGIKRATREKNRRYQTGEGYGEYAGFLTLRDAFEDRLRILRMYDDMADDQGLPDDVLFMVDRWWAPRQQYRQKLGQIITDYDLTQLDMIETTAPPGPADSAPEVSGGDPRPWRIDPRDVDHPGQPVRLATGYGDRGPSWLGHLLAVALPFILPKILGPGGGLLGQVVRGLLDAIKGAEISIPGTRRGAEREADVVGRAAPLADGLLGELAPVILPALIQALVGQLNRTPTRLEGAAREADQTRSPLADLLLAALTARP